MNSPVEGVIPGVRESKGGVTITVRVTPRASANKLLRIEDGLKVQLTAPPVDGLANRALCEFMARVLDLPRSAVTLEHGQKSRVKTVLAAGLTMDAALPLLHSASK